jgi:hypothetical protein
MHFRWSTDSRYCLYFWIRFIVYGNDSDVVPQTLRSFQNEKRKLTVTSDQADTHESRYNV